MTLLLIIVIVNINSAHKSRYNLLSTYYVPIIVPDYLYLISVVPRAALVKNDDDQETKVQKNKSCPKVTQLLSDRHSKAE